MEGGGNKLLTRDIEMLVGFYLKSIFRLKNNKILKKNKKNNNNNPVNQQENRLRIELSISFSSLHYFISFFLFLFLEQKEK